ncbi:MAG: tetratricopeptide repeat protein [Prevotella sp.]|nr:tetratricopeptide repeat protein [Prevotella sp.]
MTDDTAYFESEGFKKILRQYEDSVKSGHPAYMDADDLADIADYYHYEGRLDDASAAIELALQFNPDAVGPLLYKAREALSYGNFEVARDYAKRIRIIDSAEYLYLLGEILICEGKTEEADELFRKQFMELPPDEQMDYVYDIANLFAEYNNYNKSFEWMARSQGDDSDDFKELMARTLFGIGKYEDSSRLFNELLDHNPFSKVYWNALASAQFMSEDYGASIASSEYAIAIDPNDAESILTKANGLYHLENYEEALSYFEKYSEKNSSDEFGYLHQGTCLINLGRFDEAISRLLIAEENALPDSQYLPEIYQELAFAYSELKQPETALYYIDKTENLECDHIDMEVIRGHILVANKRLKEAEIVFKNVITKSGNAPKTMLRVMVSLYDNRYVSASYKLFKRFFNFVDDDWNEGYSYMALCCWDIKHYDEFLDYLRKAVEKNPREAKMVLGHLFPVGMKVTEYQQFIEESLKES